MKSSEFNIPVALFLFKRSDTVLRIMKVLEKVRPKKLYLIADGPRNDDEKKEVDKARKKIEESITWECEIIKNYSQFNRGVYQNIACGAIWVLKREETAIFLEDDNLPEETFFKFCEELLIKYKDNEKVLWVCGTNYLEKYRTKNEDSYVFTKLLMPCGWASWSHKFEKNYDGDMTFFDDEEAMERIKKSYINQPLYKQQIVSGKSELYRKNKGNDFSSWDFQMALSIRAKDLYGISPVNNQIVNIGVDEYSIHGGNSYDNEMTRRFCSIESFPLEFPLKHPKSVERDLKYEDLVENIILFPRSQRYKEFVAAIVKKAFGISIYEKFSIKKIFKGK